MIEYLCIHLKQMRIQMHLCLEREEVLSRGEKLAFAILRLCWSLFICSWNNTQHKIIFCVKQHSANLPCSYDELHQPVTWPESALNPVFSLVAAGSHHCTRWAILSSGWPEGRAGQPQSCKAGSSVWAPSHFQTGVCWGRELTAVLLYRNLSVASFFLYV